MTYETEKKGSAPTHIVKVPTGPGRHDRLTKVGVAWVNADGTFTVDLYGKQIVEDRLYGYAMENGSGA